MKLKLLFTVIFFLLIIVSASASVTISPLHDNQVSLLGANTVMKDGVYANIGLIHYTSDLNRYLIRFDLQNIQVKENITKVILRVQRISNTWDNNEPYVLHAVTQDWSTNSVTWNNQPSYDLVSAVSGALKAYGIYEFDVTDIVRQRLNGNAADYGFLIKKQNEELEGTGLFVTKDAGAGGSARMPDLVIKYAADSVPSTPALPPAPEPSNPTPEPNSNLVLVSTGNIFSWNKLNVIKNLNVEMYRAKDGLLLKSRLTDEDGAARFKQEEIPVDEPVYFIGKKENVIYELSRARMHYTVLNPGEGKVMCRYPVKPHLPLVQNCGSVIYYELSYKGFDQSEPTSKVFYKEYPDYQEGHPFIATIQPGYSDSGPEDYFAEMYRARDNTLLFSAFANTNAAGWTLASSVSIHSAFIPNNEHVYFVLYKGNRRYEHSVQGKHITYVDTGSDKGLCAYKGRTEELWCYTVGHLVKVNTPSKNPFDTPASEENDDDTEESEDEEDDGGQPVNEMPEEEQPSQEGEISTPESDEDDTELVVLDVALESLSITFKSLSERSQAIAAYYSSRDESKQHLWLEIAADFSTLHATVEEMKERIAAASSLNSKTRSYLKDKMKEIKDTLKQIRTKIASSR